MEERTKQKELEDIKNEILKEVDTKKNKRRLNWGSVIVTGTLILLILIAFGQIFQSANILNKIKSGAIKPASAETNSSLPSSLQNLPNMVGGC